MILKNIKAHFHNFLYSLFWWSAALAWLIIDLVDYGRHGSTILIPLMAWWSFSLVYWTRQLFLLAKGPKDEENVT